MLNLTSLISSVNLTTVLVALSFCIAAYLWLFMRRGNFPPGPRGYPILGQLPFLLKDPFIQLDEYRKQYGPFYGIQFGRRQALVLGDFASIKETYKVDGLAARPPEIFNLSSEFENLMEMKGKQWNDHRKFVVAALRDSHRERSTEDMIQDELTRLLASLKNKDLSEDLDLRRTLSTVTNNVGAAFVIGKTYAENDPMTKFFLSYNARLLAYFRVRAFASALKIPRTLQAILFSEIRAGREAVKEMDIFIQCEIKSHEEALNPDNPRDFIDLSLIDIQKSDSNRKLDGIENLRGDCLVLLIGGNETTRVSLEWMILLLAKHQDIQEKVYKEIMDVVGNDVRPSWSDRSRLPFTEAVTLESQRLFTLGPLNLMRCTTKDVKIRGYDIPKDTWVIANFWAVHFDSELWEEPKKFKPERFLSKEGDKTITPEFWLPFSIGNRNCAGDKVAKMEMFLTLTTLLQNYLILPPSNGVSLEAELTLAYRPVHTHVRLVKRN